MAEADLSKIISVIMENPMLIEQIKALASSDKSGSSESLKAEPQPTEEPEAPTAPATYEPEIKRAPASRRKNLLYAIKPYLSEERSKAIETMLSIADILDMMKTR